MFDPSVDRFGSGCFCDARMRRRAGIHKKQGAYIGHDAAGRPVTLHNRVPFCVAAELGR